MTDEQLMIVAAVLLSAVGILVTLLGDWLWNRKYVSFRGQVANNWWKMLLAWPLVGVAIWWILYVPFYLTYFGHH